jgi:hypothetical protein
MEQMQQNTYVAPTAVIQPTFVADVTKQAETTAAVNAEYSFTTFAKMMLTAFAVIVVALLSWICVNTNAIQQKTFQQILYRDQETLINKVKSNVLQSKKAKG